MKSTTLCAALAALMAAGSAATLAQAQDVSPDYAQQQQDYQQKQEQYQADQSHYQDQAAQYAARRAAYAHQREHYERAREAYDAQYGAGAFVHYYSVHPGEYDSRYGLGAYERDFGRPVSYDGPND